MADTKRYWPKDYQRAGIVFPKKCTCGEIHNEGISPRRIVEIDTAVRTVMERANRDGECIYVGGHHTYQGDDRPVPCAECRTQLYVRPYLRTDIAVICAGCAALRQQLQGTREDRVVVPENIPGLDNPREVTRAIFGIGLMAKIAGVPDDVITERMADAPEKPDLFGDLLGLSEKEARARIQRLLRSKKGN